MGGTRGSHFLTYHRRLAELLQGQAVYSEARDGRPVFLLPFLGGTLVGTTDIPFEGDPAQAVATDEEIDYLLQVVADVFPDAGVSRGDIAMHQCGVRPLPYADAKTPAAITRRHLLVWNDESPLPLVSLVGGKLTTCRSLAEETAAAVLARLGKKPHTTSRDRPIPPTAVDAFLNGWQVGRSFPPPEVVQSAVDDEWVTHLEDLVERRLMLHFTPRLSRATLVGLATALVERGKLRAGQADFAVERCTQRLTQHFGIQTKNDNNRPMTSDI
jgi:glycerol-3-phosphate dehydrogenase